MEINGIYIMSVYKITGGDLCYIGSTKRSINERFRKHKESYKEWKLGNKKQYCSSFNIFDLFGVENCKIELLEKTETLLDRERFHIQNTDCVNIRVPNRSKKEHYQDTRPRQLEYKKKVVVCICGQTYTQAHKARHYKSQRHINLCQPPQSQNTNQSSSETSSLPDSQDQLTETHSFQLPRYTFSLRLS